MNATIKRRQAISYRLPPPLHNVFNVFYIVLFFQMQSGGPRNWHLLNKRNEQEEQKSLVKHSRSLTAINLSCMLFCKFL